MIIIQVIVETSVVISVLLIFWDSLLIFFGVHINSRQKQQQENPLG